MFQIRSQQNLMEQFMGRVRLCSTPSKRLHRLTNNIARRKQLFSKLNLNLYFELPATRPYANKQLRKGRAIRHLYHLTSLLVFLLQEFQ